MELSNKIKIYSIFYILLLESADPKILVFIWILIKLSQNNKYKIKEITEYNPKIRQYIIK